MENIYTNKKQKTTRQLFRFSLNLKQELTNKQPITLKLIKQTSLIKIVASYYMTTYNSTHTLESQKQKGIPR